MTLSAGTQGSVIVVGGPGYRLNNVTASPTVGRVTAFAWPRGAAPPNPYATPLFTITGITSLVASPPHKGSPKVGATLAIGRPLGATHGSFLAIGIPNTGNGTSEGAVLVVPLLLSGDYAWSSAVSASRALLLGSQPDARLGGGGLAFADVNGDGADELFAAAPMYTPDYVLSAARRAALGVPSDGLFGHELGCVFGFAGGASFPSGMVSAAESVASWYAEGTSSSGRFGAALAAWDANGDGVAEAIAVAAPRGFEPAAAFNVTHAEHAGAVFVFKF